MQVLRFVMHGDETLFWLESGSFSFLFYLKVVLKWNLVDWVSWLHAKLEIEFHGNDGVELNIFLKII